MKQQKAEKIVNQHILWSLGAGLVPFPVLDVLAVTVIQLDMLKQLCRAYEVSYSESNGKAMLSAVTGSTLARLGASAIKAIPGIGTVLGGVSMPILSGASTYAIGHAVTWHFDTGGSLFDIEFSSFKDLYDELFKKGKEVAQQMQRTRGRASSDETVFTKLEELLRLKEKGLITEEEFETKKQQLLEDL